MGQGEAPGRGSGAKVSWSEAPLEPSLSFRDRLAMSGWGEENKGVSVFMHVLFLFLHVKSLTRKVSPYSQFSQSLRSPKT